MPQLNLAIFITPCVQEASQRKRVVKSPPFEDAGIVPDTCEFHWNHLIGDVPSREFDSSNMNKVDLQSNPITAAQTHL
jgi:hypothetical protein